MCAENCARRKFRHKKSGESAKPRNRRRIAEVFYFPSALLNSISVEVFGLKNSKSSESGFPKYDIFLNFMLPTLPPASASSKIEPRNTPFSPATLKFFTAQFLIKPASHGLPYSLFNALAINTFWSVPLEYIFMFSKGQIYIGQID